MTAPLLSIRDLRTWFYTEAGVARAVDGVSFDIGAGETLGLVGESGSGKSVTALSILRLIQPPGRIESGSIIEFDGKDIVTLDDEEIRDIRGNRISMIFQEPMSALNPVFTIGDQVAEVARVHAGVSRKEAWDRAVEMLALTGMPDAESRAKQYPHQLSGGMRQRVLIAMALMMKPALVIADEPTTALDVTIQAQILDLIGELKDRLGMAVVLITHDLGVVAQRADEVAVMYAGRIVERAQPDVLFARPLHPYTVGLMNSIPSILDKRARLEAIPGIVPSPLDWPSGCRFRTRCSRAQDDCADAPPQLVEVEPSHWVACIKATTEPMAMRP